MRPPDASLLYICTMTRTIIVSLCGILWQGW